MNKMRFTSILLALMLSASAVSACGDEGTSPAQNISAQTQDIQAEPAVETEPETTGIPDDLPETDFEGRTFNLAIRTVKITDFYTDEQNGEAVNDAVFDAVTAKKETYADSFEKRLKSNTKKMDKLMSIYDDAE